jgi:hypothetical protein
MTATGKLILSEYIVDSIFSVLNTCGKRVHSSGTSVGFFQVIIPAKSIKADTTSSFYALPQSSNPFNAGKLNTGQKIDIERLKNILLGARLQFYLKNTKISLPSNYQ